MNGSGLLLRLLLPDELGGGLVSLLLEQALTSRALIEGLQQRLQPGIQWDHSQFLLAEAVLKKTETNVHLEQEEAHELRFLGDEEIIAGPGMATLMLIRRPVPRLFARGWLLKQSTGT